MGEYSKSKYGVFIVESMDTVNEGKGKLDGYTLKQMLDLCDIPNTYYYIRTRMELEKIVHEFESSGYRFLHLSCHGNSKGIELTYESLDFDELDLILGDFLYHRRLFISACEVAVFDFAEHFIPKYHCFSVIGTPDSIEYDKAAIFWSSFYYLMYRNDSNQMIQADITPTLQKVSNTFNVKLNYFSIIKDSNPKSVDHLKVFYVDSGTYTTELLKTQYKNQYRVEDIDFDSDSSDSS